MKGRGWKEPLAITQKEVNSSQKKIKTTIDLPEEMWKKFSIKVIQKHGGRKKNDVIQELIEKYLDDDDD